jgi:hypothetical protein
MAESRYEPSAACRQFDAELAVYLEGEARPHVAAHARECASCGALLADLELIQQTARVLPLEEPSPVVWANVRARLEAEGAFGERVVGWREIFHWRAFPHAIPLGTLALLVFMGSLLTLSYNRSSATDEAARRPPMTQLASALPTTEEGALAGLASELESNFRVREASMAPDLKATYEKSLVSLNGSIRECLDSLQQEPSNTLAHDYLLTAYTRKAEILSSALESEGR